MEFGFSEEQQALQTVARDLFASVSPPRRLREVWERGERGTAVWAAMADVGLLGIGIPEAFGGMGGDAVDLVLVLEEAGYAGLPEPLVDTVAVAAPLLLAAGSDEVQAAWLPGIATGETQVAVRLAGQPHVCDADIADLVLWEDEDGCFAVPPEQITAERVASEDGARRIFTVRAATTEADRLPGGADALARAHDHARYATAAVLNGVSRRLVDLSVEHARVRQQFDTPVGAFQAVQHMLASAWVEAESARAAAWYAAYALARDLPDAADACRVAKAAANDAGATANRHALQVHGGIGFTWEHDLHLWLKRSLALQAAHGSTREQRAVLAGRLLDD